MSLRDCSTIHSESSMRVSEEVARIHDVLVGDELHVSDELSFRELMAHFAFHLHTVIAGKPVKIIRDVDKTPPLERPRWITAWDIRIDNRTHFSCALYAPTAAGLELPLLSYLPNEQMEHVLAPLSKEALPPKNSLSTSGGIIAWLRSSRETHILKIVDSGRFCLYCPVSRRADFAITYEFVAKQISVCLAVNLTSCKTAEEIDALFDRLHTTTSVLIGNQRAAHMKM